MKDWGSGIPLVWQRRTGSRTAIAEDAGPGTLLRPQGPVAQSGQSSGLIIRRLQVQILPGPPTTTRGNACLPGRRPREQTVRV
jgi:hypothetical protein